jgi:hypothetical protein
MSAGPGGTFSNLKSWTMVLKSQFGLIQDAKMDKKCHFWQK